MPEVTFTWADPASPDLNDSQPFQLGVKFRVSTGVPCTGVEWRVPNTLPSAGTTISLWSAAGSRLATASVTYSGSGLVKKYFAASVNLSAGTDYYASVFTPNRYVATTSFTWPHTTGILTAQANNGWLQFEDIFPDVESGNDANFHVSPIVETGNTISGAASGALGALSAAATGTRVVLGTASAALGGLTALANALAAGSMSRATTATAAGRASTSDPSGYFTTSGGGRL